MGFWSQMRRTGVMVATVALAMTVGGCAASPSVDYTPIPQAEGDLPAALQEQLESAVTTAMAASGASGAIVGVWAPWSGSWVAGLGTQGVDSDEPVTPEQTFRVGTVTRLMTCDLLYSMADRGVVKLSDSVTTYVSGVADMSTVTLLDLCNGTAGVTSSAPTLRNNWLINPTREWGARELASYGLQKKTGARGAYADSDAGYHLLGAALERAGDDTASRLLKKYVFDPLRLKETSLPGPRAAEPSETDALRGYYLQPSEDDPSKLDCAAPVDITVSSSSIGFTDSGAVSTITDLGRYMQAEAAQALRTQEKPPRFGAPLPAYNGAPSWYQATGGAYVVGSMIGQHGWAPGYITAAYADPETGFTVAVVLNSSSAGANTIAALAWQLAALASKAPAVEGFTAPEFGLPFTAETYGEQIVNSALCEIPPADAESADDGDAEGETSAP
ncbi:serine hydrolase domain-containing protein [Microbacterium sp. YY-01]|uniref:serine hydrolase domain-containing protein n=1 Tax=Microbacterium sp. YY-01 TaxID=3421634 RepID=UPI003D17ACE2